MRCGTYALHTCAAPDCKVGIARGLLMCPGHWSRVSADLQRAVNAAWTAYKARAASGEELVGSDAHRNYYAARSAAIVAAGGEPLVKLALLPVAPVGEHQAMTHLNRGSAPHEWKRTTVEDYPPSPRGDELARLRLDHPTLQRREVCTALGISPSDHIALENGRLTLSDVQWAWALATARALGGGAP